METGTETDGEDRIGTQDFLEMEVCWGRLEKEAAGRVVVNISNGIARTRAKAKEKEMERREVV